jgi:diguanylate cyclase (GGDEF)-like protein
MITNDLSGAFFGILPNAVPGVLTALGFLAVAFAVNDLFAGTGTSVLLHRRTALMVAALTGALMQASLIVVAPYNMALLNRVLGAIAALSFVALPVLFWPSIRRIKRGQMKIVSRRLLTRARRAEETARAARSWLNMAEQAAHVGHWQLTVPENRLIWSDEMFRIHGLWKEHYRPNIESALAAFHPLDGKRLAALLQEVAAHGGELDVAARLRRPDGEIRHVNIRGQAVQSWAGAVQLVNGVMVDVTEPKRAETRPPAHAGALDGTAAEDPLTGLADRRQFEASLGYEFKRAVRSKKPLGLVLIEIDQFNQYSTHYGTHQADICLRNVALAVQAVPRRTGDIVARYGETEIAVLLPLADGAGALRVAAQIMEAIRVLGLTDAGRDNGMLTVSGGAAAFTMDDLYNPLELTRRAARALADARLYGGDRVCAYREPEFAEALAVRS